MTAVARSKTRRFRTRAQRQRRIRHIRAAIRTGSYENDLKLHIAVDRLVEQLSGAARASDRA